MRAVLFLGLLLVLLALPDVGADAQSLRSTPDPNVLSYPNVNAEVSSDATPLLMSNSPETPRQSGLLYRDTTQGEARVVAYHANGLGVRARLVVLARNVSAQPVSLTTRRRGTAMTHGPDPLTGQRTLLRYFASRALPSGLLAPGEARLLYTSEPLPLGAVASAMLDVHSTGATRISVVLLASDRPLTPETLDALPVLTRDAHHQRGTFPGANRTLRIVLPGETARVTLGHADDLTLSGQDALSGDQQVLRGHFGVQYTLEVQGAANSQLGISARGGAYRGVLNVEDGARTAALLVGAGAALKDASTPALLWHARSDTLRLTFVPANGSHLPLALLFYRGLAKSGFAAPGPPPGSDDRLHWRVP
ncbi:hypothetical protein [Deinococcus peraridilitoris]|uniref:hypothetical protein n=1 Tax=Deinococcus peraridilitoris TaxID=432329 RepID=UPI0012FB7C14|nr:hypothetical protein [Deinococcus peraridilitoris]